MSSRFSFIIIFILGFFPLAKILKKKQPDYLIIHLITSLPLILLIFFNFKTKFILRISGYPKMNFFRKIIWKLAFKKIYAITCPTKLTQEYILNLNIIDKSKVYLLFDPIIEVKKKKDIKSESIVENNFFLSVGRLTKQKNFIFLCRCFKKLIDDNKLNLKLFIAGEGEQKRLLSSYIKKNNLQKNIYLIGHKENIYNYMIKARALILSSLWEDPGFVLLESAFNRTIIISSDCNNGPKELLKNGLNSFVFKTGDEKSFLETFKVFNKSNVEDISSIKVNALKLTKKFSLFQHYKNLKNILN